MSSKDRGHGRSGRRMPSELQVVRDMLEAEGFLRVRMQVPDDEELGELAEDLNDAIGENSELASDLARARLAHRALSRRLATKSEKCDALERSLEEVSERFDALRDDHQRISTQRTREGIRLNYLRQHMFGHQKDGPFTAVDVVRMMNRIHDDRHPADMPTEVAIAGCLCSGCDGFEASIPSAFTIEDPAPKKPAQRERAPKASKK